MYALIKNGKVDNIIEAEGYRESQIIAKNGGFDDAIDITLYDVAIGDLYTSNGFTKSNGTVITRNLTAEEKIAQLTKQLEASQEALDTLIMGGK